MASSTAGETITCKAGVVWEAGQPISIEQIQVAPPQSKEVRIKITHTSLCHTDIFYWKGKDGGAWFPRILGHEGAGIVESVGSEVTELKAGDHVIPTYMAECKECELCDRGKNNVCELFRFNFFNGVAYSDKKCRFSLNGKPIHHLVGLSTFSQYTVVHISCVAKVNPEAPLDKICLLGCGVPAGLGGINSVLLSTPRRNLYPSMKFLASVALAGTALLNGAAAYPQIMSQIIQERAAEAESNPEASMLETRQANPTNPLGPPVFDPKFQHVSTTGKYKFIAPGPTDQRGPCPGLNALANHGYLPHNGIGTIDDFIESTYNGFGMGRDLGAFLGVYGAIFDGNLQSYSIGFASAQLPVISGMLGTPQGLGGSHNKYENDASPIRGDLYTYGNSYLNQVSLFNDFIQKKAGVPEDEVNYDIPTIIKFRKERFDNSIANNPYFFNGPFSGAIASTAAFSFMYRFMANKSEEYPEGRLSRNDLMHFYSMKGTAPNFKYTPGHEKFPNHWYKRAVNDPYSIPFFIIDAAAFGLYAPEFFSIGGNTGKVNTFTGIDPSDLTGGVYNSQNLKNPKNLACFFFQLIVQSTPDLLEGIFTNVTPAKNALTAAANKAFASFNCPKLAKLQYGQEKLKTYPGYGKAYNGYTPPS